MKNLLVLCVSTKTQCSVWRSICSKVRRLPTTSVRRSFCGCGAALYLSLLGADGDYLPILEGIGVKELDDGSFTTRFVLNPTDFGETVTVQGENLYDGSVFGTVTLEKIG